MISGKITVIGAGSWGTALADLFCRHGHSTSLWVRNKKRSEQIRQSRENRSYLPGIKLPPDLQITNQLEEALQKAALVIIAVPSPFIRPVLQKMKKFLSAGVPILSASKGIEQSSLLRVSQIIGQELGGHYLAALSGPNFALEVAKGLPCAAVIASESEGLAVELQKKLATSKFRLYSSSDLIGVELGGALKNVVAIASGVSDGLGFGYNARAALITRGLSEISRLGKAWGANPLTFMGLSGMGDLMLTCTGDLSRNRRVGLALAQGRTLDEILAEMRMVAEGVRTSESAVALARKTGVELPIMEGVYNMLYHNKPPRRLINELLSRDLKSEL